MIPDKEHELLNKIARLEHQVSILSEKARQADSDSQAKSDFLAMISHEIRTPMNGIMGLCELLLETDLEPRQSKFANLIQSSAESLLTLLNSLLDFSKIEADKMEIEIKEFDLKALLNEIVEVFKLSGTRKGLEVGLVLDPRICQTYLGDAYRIRQILFNLLGNAIKFTDTGMVLLNVTLDRAGQDWLRFTVVDNGIGIPKEKQARLFDPFSQVDSSSGRQYSGTGLGLSICKKLIELMGGKLGVESEEGQGSSFWFILPLKGLSCEKKQRGNAVATDRATNQTEQVEVPLRAKILLVDDNEVNRMVLEETFRKTNADITVAVNGQEAIDFCTNQFFDLILMDCRMPLVDGYEATRKIRNYYEEQQTPGTVIIALTADGTSTAKNKCQSVGMDGFLLKPLDTGKLQKILDRYLAEFNLDVTKKPVGPNGKSVHHAQVSEQVVDFQALDKLCANIGDLKKVIGVFLNLLPRRLAELEGAVRRLDSKEIKSLAHTLKGSSSQFGAVGLAKLCAEAEDMAHAKHLGGIEQLLARIQRTAAEVSKILEEQLD